MNEKKKKKKSALFPKLCLADNFDAGLTSGVRSESDCESRGRWFKPQSGHILSLRFGHEKIFYDHSFPYGDSRRAVVSYWQKNGH